MAILSGPQCVDSWKTIRLWCICPRQLVFGMWSTSRNMLTMLWWLWWYDTGIHDGDIIIGTMASQITSLTIVYSAVYSGTYQRKHQSSASLAFMRGIHQGQVNSPHKWPVTRKMCPFDDVIMRMSVSLCPLSLFLRDNNYFVIRILFWLDLNEIW